MGPDQRSIWSCLQLGGIDREGVSLTVRVCWHLQFPQMQETSFFSVFCYGPSNFWQLFCCCGCFCTLSCPFCGAACEGLRIPGGSGQSPWLSMQHVGCLLPPAPLYWHTCPSAVLWACHAAWHPSQLAFTLTDLPSCMSLGNFVTSQLVLLFTLPVVMLKSAGPTADLCRASATSHLPLTGFLSCSETFSHSSTFPGCLVYVRPFGEGFCQKSLKNLEGETASLLSMFLLTPIKGH